MFISPFALKLLPLEQKPTNQTDFECLYHRTIYITWEMQSAKQPILSCRKIQRWTADYRAPLNTEPVHLYLN